MKDFFVRPVGSHNNPETGLTYENAWLGMDNVLWGGDDETTVTPGSTLWMSGIHYFLSDNTLFKDSGTDAENLITIRGDYNDKDLGQIFQFGSVKHNITQDYIKIKNLIVNGSGLGTAKIFFLTGGSRTDFTLDGITSNFSADFMGFATSSYGTLLNYNNISIINSEFDGGDLVTMSKIFSLSPSATSNDNIVMSNFVFKNNKCSNFSSTVVKIAGNDSTPRFKIINVDISDNEFYGIQNTAVVVNRGKGLTAEGSSLSYSAGVTTITLNKTLGSDLRYLPGQEIEIFATKVDAGPDINGTYVISRYDSSTQEIDIPFESQGGVYRQLRVIPTGSHTFSYKNNKTIGKVQTSGTGGGLQLGGFLPKSRADYGDTIVKGNLWESIGGTGGGVVLTWSRYVEMSHNMSGKHYVNSLVNGSQTSIDASGLDVDVNCENVRVHSNYVYDLEGDTDDPSDPNSHSGYGIFTLGGHNIHVYNNIIENCRHGIFSGSIGEKFNHTIRNNTILNSTYYGYWCDNTTNLDEFFLENNVIDGSGLYAIYQAPSIPGTSATARSTTTSTTQCIDSTEDFVAEGISVGDLVLQTEDNIFGRVTNVVDSNTLDIDNDLFSGSLKNYVIVRKSVLTSRTNCLNNNNEEYGFFTDEIDFTSDLDVDPDYENILEVLKVSKSKGIFLDGMTNISATSPIRSSGRKYWGDGPRPVDFNGKAVPDYPIRLGAVFELEDHNNGFY